MTKEQFLTAMGDIDDKFIREITDAPAVLDKLQENYFADEKPQVVYLTNEHIPFWKIVVSAAAAVCILTAGILGGLKLRGIQPAESSSDVSLSSSDSSDISNISDPIISDKPSYGAFSFYFYMENRDDQNFDISSGVAKYNKTNYAYVDIQSGNLSSANIARIAITSSNIRPEDNILTEEKDAMGIGSYSLKYNDDYEGMTYLFVRTWSGDFIRFGGEWTP